MMKREEIFNPALRFVLHFKFTYTRTFNYIQHIRKKKGRIRSLINKM